METSYILCWQFDGKCKKNYGRIVKLAMKWNIIMKCINRKKKRKSPKEKMKKQRRTETKRKGEMHTKCGELINQRTKWNERKTNCRNVNKEHVQTWHKLLWMIINESHEMNNEERTTMITRNLNVETEKRREKKERETKRKINFIISCATLHLVWH